MQFFYRIGSIIRGLFATLIALLIAPILAIFAVLVMVAGALSVRRWVRRFEAEQVRAQTERPGQSPRGALIEGDYEVL